MANTASNKSNPGHTATDTRNVPENASSTLDKAKEAVGNVADKARETAGNVADKTREAAAGAVDKAKEAASTAYHSTGQALSDAGHRAEAATTSLAGTMQSLAGSIRENAPHEGMLGTASSRVADTLESGGRYLKEEGLGGMTDDLVTLIRRNPIPAVLVGIGIGFLLARTTSRS